MLKVLSFFDQERAKPPSVKVSVLTFLVKKYTMKLCGVYNVLRIREKKNKLRRILFSVARMKHLP